MGINIIYKAVAVLRIGVVMLERYFHLHTILHALAVNNVIIDRRGTLVQILYKLLNAAFIVVHLGKYRLYPLIGQSNLKSFGQKCHLTQSGLQCLEIVFCHLKHGLIRKEADRRTSLTWKTGTNHFQRITYFASLIPLFINLSFAVNGNFQPVGKGIYNRSSYTVESS